MPFPPFPDAIRFYAARDSYGCFSNFSRDPVTIYGYTWATSEHAFQAMKSLDPAIQKAIREKSSPGQAALMGRSIPLRSDWDNIVTGSTLGLVPSVRVKDEIMYEVVLAKFQQNPKALATLLSTGDSMIIEAAVSDPYWGEGCSKNGLNKLGQILMVVRKQLRG
jgi:ribA/ribD-fused uncharacterized protein